MIRTLEKKSNQAVFVLWDARLFFRRGTRERFWGLLQRPHLDGHEQNTGAAWHQVRTTKTMRMCASAPTIHAP